MFAQSILLCPTGNKCPMAALNIHIIHAPALNFASAVSPFSSWPLVATIVRWRFIPKSEVYPIAGAVAMHAMLWLALAHIGRTERIWVQERPAWEQSLDLWELLAQRGVLTLHFPAFCTYTTPARTSPLFWGPPLCVASTVRPTFLFRTLHASSIS